MKLFTRFRILNATRAMVAELGVERVTMRGIARLANITAPAIYKHFRNKRALLEEVVSRGFVELADDMLKRDKEATGVRRLKSMSRAAHDFADRYSRLFEMMAAPRSEDGRAVDRLEFELRRSMERKELNWHNPREIAISLWAQMRGFLSRKPEGNYEAAMHWVFRPVERMQLMAA
jgi:AcrR family transcriptional regulator